MICENLSVNAAGHLCFAGVDTTELAKTYGTPLYLLDEDRVRENCRTYRRALRDAYGDGAMALYAGKAMCIRALYPVLREEEMGIDVVSCGEIHIAAAAGFPMEKAFFHGNNKTDEDIAFAMEKGVGYFVSDGEEELRAVSGAAVARGIRQKVLLRVTPGIDPHTNAKICTGREDSKFGVSVHGGQAMALARVALSLPGLELCGFHCHIGSQIFDEEPFAAAADVMANFAADVRDALGYTASILDLGGGIGVRYTEDDPVPDIGGVIRAAANALCKVCDARRFPVPFVLVEPGRSIVADAGMTLYRAGTVKEIPGVRNYVSVDGGMTDNPRYTLYGARYAVYNAGKMNEPADYVCTVAGRCCESGDLVGEGFRIPKPARGDVLATLTTGAYHYSMASNYNALPKPPVVMLRGGQARVAVRRETVEDLLRTSEE